MKPRPAVMYIGRLTAKDAKQRVDALCKRYDVFTADSGRSAQANVNIYSPRIAIWDASSLRTHGDRSIRALNLTAPGLRMIRILNAGERAAGGLCDVTLHVPLTPRKLINQIEKLLNQPSDEIITVGIFTLHIQRRLLVIGAHETPLNPKLTTLLEVFMRQPNTTIDRATLMNIVWQTDYVGDTRTLDVHISKVREILKSVGASDHLRTVRGVGYRLDLS